MATETKSTSERLAELEERVREAEQRCDQVDVDRRQAEQALRAAEGERFELEKQRGAGEEVSEEDVNAALAAIEEARAETGPQLWTARAQGAERALSEATLARDRYGREAFAGLAAEIAADDGPVRDALVEAWGTLQEAAAAYARQTRRWHQLGRYGGIVVDTIPSGTPLRGDVNEVVQRFEAGIPTPTPPALEGGPVERG